MGPYKDGARDDNRASATAMALLAFQGNGDTHRSGKYKDVVDKGWKWLLRQQDSEGCFVRENIYNAHMYTQAQCTIAICELYGMTKDESFRLPAQRALDYCQDAQASEGGWRYAPRQDSDLSVTGWVLMALQSGRMAYLNVSPEKLDNVTRFLDSVQRPPGTLRCNCEHCQEARRNADDSPHGEGALYSYKSGQAPEIAMTAEGLLCRQYLGWKHGDQRLQLGCEQLLKHPISYEDENVYYWYYATQVLHHMGGRQWDEWNHVMRDVVPKAQTLKGSEAGSWPPQSDRWGAHGGRLYVTCLSIYMLEVYYRHLPIYNHAL
jgi:hypothetical protein